MSNRRYTEKFKSEAIKQVTKRGYKVRQVSERLGISSKSLYQWLRLTRGSNSKRGQGSDSELRQEIVRLKSELKRAEEERDILKRLPRTLPANNGKVRIHKDHRREFRVVSMCGVLKVHRSGFYAWIKNPLPARNKEDLRLLQLIGTTYDESHGIYGSPRVLGELREREERCGRKRVARIVRQHKIRADRGYKKPRFKNGKPANVFSNRLREGVEVRETDQAWVTYITYIRTYEGWLYLAVVMDLYSRMIIGWLMKPTPERELMLDAFLMAV